MDLKRYAVILTAIMMMCTSGCGNVKSTNKTEKANSSSVTKSVASTVSMPDSVHVPEGGWTYETIKDVFYINGKNLELPYAKDGLGEEYSYEDYSIVGTHSNIFFSSEYFWLAISVSNNDRISAIQLFSR